MQTDVVILILSLALLLFPRRWLRLGKSYFASVRSSGSDSPSHTRHPWDKSLNVREEFSKSRNYIDLLRGAVGGWGLMHSGIAAKAAAYSLNGSSTVLIVQLTVLAVALIIQTLHWGNRHTTHPPVFFLGGLSFGFVGVPAAVCGFASVWALCELIANPAFFIALQSAAVVAFGCLLNGVNKTTLCAGALGVVPLLFSALLRRPLAIGTHKVRA